MHEQRATPRFAKGSNTIFFFATLREAARTITMFEAVEKEGEKGRFLFPGGEIIICGMGVDSARAAVSQATFEQCVWINLGIAGCIDVSVPVGTAIPIGRTALLHKAGEEYTYLSEEMIVLNTALPATVFTAPQPLYAPPQVSCLMSLVDMEGYACAKIAYERRVPLFMTKVVSDFCTSTSHADIIKNVDALSYVLADEALSFKERLNIQRQASIPRLAGS